MPDPKPRAAPQSIEAISSHLLRGRRLQAPPLSNWMKAAFTLDILPVAAERARERRAKNPEFFEKLKRLGRERELIDKTLVLTGLWKVEFASTTAGQHNLEVPMPYVVFDKADEKNRQQYL